MIHAELPCKVIYSKDYQHGTLFAIELSKRLEVSRMDTAILELDKTLQHGTQVFTTRFTSISDMLSGKIKTFGHGERKSDFHYREIYSLKGNFLPDVKPWFPPEGAEPVDDGAPVNYEEESEDEAEMHGTDAAFEEKEDIQSRDPKSNGKKRAAEQCVDELKKMKLNNGNPGSVDGCMLEELREKLDKCTVENSQLKTELDAAKALPLVSVFFRCLRQIRLTHPSTGGECGSAGGYRVPEAKACGERNLSYHLLIPSGATGSGSFLPRGMQCADLILRRRWCGSPRRSRRRTSGWRSGWRRWRRTGTIWPRRERSCWIQTPSWRNRFVCVVCFLSVDSILSAVPAVRKSGQSEHVPGEADGGHDSEACGTAMGGSDGFRAHCEGDDVCGRKAYSPSSQAG